MSLQDIKDSYSIIKINNIDYKIAYDNKAIMELEEIYNVSFMELGSVLDDFNKKSLKDLLEFCFVGFKKYHPEISKDILDEVISLTQLIDICYNEFTRKIVSPEIFKDLVHIAEDNEKSKKKQTPLQRLTSYISQKLS